MITSHIEVCMYGCDQKFIIANPYRITSENIIVILLKFMGKILSFGYGEVKERLSKTSFMLEKGNYYYYYYYYETSALIK